MKKLLLAALLFTGACSLVSTGTQNQGLPTDSVSIDTSPAAQAEYKKQWLEAVTNKVFSGDANVFGDGPSSLFNVFAFDKEGNLHDTGTPVGRWYSLHRVLIFKSGTQAVVRFYRSASTTLYNEIYALEVRGDKIYRTENIRIASSGNPGAMGFSTLDKWDGIGYSSEKIALFAPITKSIAYPTLTVPGTNS